MNLVSEPLNQITKELESMTLISVINPVIRKQLQDAIGLFKICLLSEPPSYLQEIIRTELVDQLHWVKKFETSLQDFDTYLPPCGASIFPSKTYSIEERHERFADEILLGAETIYDIMGRDSRPIWRVVSRYQGQKTYESDQLESEQESSETSESELSDESDDPDLPFWKW